MKYAIYSSIALIFCIAVAVLAVRLIGRRKKMPLPLKILLGVLITVATSAALMLAYFSVYYHADVRALTCLKGSSSVEVSKTDDGWLFDGPGEGSALIFYPGGKVEAAAYAPLMLSLAESGEDSFLVKMPLNFTLFGADKAEDIMEDYRDKYSEWNLGGHSLGGVVASGYAADHSGEIKNLFLIGSYPTSSVKPPTKLTAIRGSKDGCLDLDEFRKSMEIWPPDSKEVVIEGGNHSQCGSYGLQKGDNPADISADEQTNQTAAAIIKRLKK